MLENIGQRLRKEHQARLETVMRKNKEVFAWEGVPLGRTKVVQHRIETQGAGPIKQHPRRLPAAYREELEQMIQSMLREGVIKSSQSPWASPTVLVKKKSGALRLCVDYRRLNQITRKDSFPLPLIDDILETLGGAKYFNTLDLASGYWQVEFHPKDKEKTVFCILTGIYEFETMPFGLANAPATFQRLVVTVLDGLIPNKCLVCLDDVIVPGGTLDEHMKDLEEVIMTINAARLRLKPEKCVLIKSGVRYLDHVISESGIRSDPEKTSAIESWPCHNLMRM